MKRGETAGAEYCRMGKSKWQMGSTITNTRFCSGRPNTLIPYGWIKMTGFWQEKTKAEPLIDRYTGFLYLDKNEMPIVALH